MIVDVVESSTMVFNSSCSMSAVKFGVIVPFLIVPESELKDKTQKETKKDAHNSFSFLFLTDFFPFFSGKRKSRHKDDVLVEKGHEEPKCGRTAESSSKG